MSQAVLEAKGLSKEFKSGESRLVVLSHVNFSLGKGESLAIVGPSGSGKSTLLGLLAGLEKPSHGSVSVQGTDLASLSESKLARFRGGRIGFVFQSYRLMPALSALENVRLPLDLAGGERAQERALAWLDKVGLKARARHRPAELSGGEQQRVALARALAHEPALVMADEPTGNLDSRIGRLVADTLFDLVKKSGASLVLVTHDEKLAARADRVLRLKDGHQIKGKRGRLA